MKGVPASPGLGAGAVFLLREREVPIAGCLSIEPESELDRLVKGIGIAAAYYRKLADRIRFKVGKEDAEIFEGHLELLTGEDLEEGVRTIILSEKMAAETAVMHFAEETAEEFRQLESDYFRQRADDILDIGRRLAEAIYYGSISDPGALPDSCVVIAEQLTPSGAARLDTEKVVAIATEKGGRTSHAAILARSLCIPCVTGVPGLVEGVRSGQLVIVDGDRGVVDTDVTEAKIEEAMLRKARERRTEQERMVWSASTEARTADGSSVTIAANVGGKRDAEQAKRYGAQGVGLLRSEFIFMRYSDFPTVSQQVEEYRGVCLAVAPEHVIVRLLDCGADKPLPYATAPAEDNPFLGLRGIRYQRARSGSLDDQLIAIAKVASEGFPIKVMIPMVISVEEVRMVRSRLKDLAPQDETMPRIGIMVETPASVMTIERLAHEIDFVSIGTNDLVQYTLAVDRGNPAVAHLYQELHPAVLHAIDRVVKVCHELAIPVGVCGDMASHPETAIALLALGVDELSASINAIPELKAACAAVSRKQLGELHGQLLSCESADQARAFIIPLLASSYRRWLEVYG